jgi:hypothetical protein
MVPESGVRGDEVTVAVKTSTGWCMPASRATRFCRGAVARRHRSGVGQRCRCGQSHLARLHQSVSRFRKAGCCRRNADKKSHSHVRPARQSACGQSVRRHRLSAETGGCRAAGRRPRELKSPPDSPRLDLDHFGQSCLRG